MKHKHHPLALCLPASLSEEAIAQLIELFQDFAQRLQDHQHLQHLHALDTDERQLDWLDDDGPPF